jgi:AcrR family transcriptional regulator
MANPAEIQGRAAANSAGGSTRDAVEGLRPPEVKRRRILTAATRLFARRGFAKTTVEEIALEAGVSKGLVYVHFPSKEALLEKVLSIAIVEWSEATKEATRGLGDSMAELIASVLSASIVYAKRNPILCAILGQDPRGLLPEQLDHTDRLARNYTRTMERFLRRGVERGELREDLDVEYTARYIWLLHRALVNELFVPGRSPRELDSERLVESVAAMITSGLLGPAAWG